MGLLLKGGKILDGETTREADILVQDSKILKIGKDLNALENIVNIKGKVVLPGLIDPHVHLREPGFEHKEDFQSGGEAAAAGGYTSVVDMPNTNPPTTTLEALELKRKLSKKSKVNVFFYFGVDKSCQKVLCPKGVVGVKVFLNESTGRMMVSDEAYLRQVFKAFKHVAVHAEDEMVEFACKLTEQCGNQLYLCHISQKKELEIVRNYKGKIKAYVEVTPHHLFLEESDAKSPFQMMKPPLRKASDVRALWKAISDSEVDTIGTDHAPHTINEKREKTCYGVPGLETALPLMLDSVNQGKLKLHNVQELMSSNPAEILGLKNKGRIAQDFDADLTVIDLSKEFIVKGKELKTKCKWSPFEGRKLKGAPVLTIVGGKVIFNNL